MKKKLVFTGIFILMCVTLLTAQEPLNIYKSDEANFTLKYPADWKSEKAKGYFIVFYGPGKDSRLAVFADKLKNNVTPDEFIAEIEKLQIKNCENYKVLNKRSGALAGVPAYQKTYSFTNTGRDGKKYNIIGKDIYIIKNNMAYILEYSCLEELFEKNQSQFENIVKTFQFLK